MRSDRKRLTVFGIGALVLLAIAVSNSAIISSIDAAYSRIISSDITNRKKIAIFERNCNTIHNTALSMILTEDTTEQMCLQKEVFELFTVCDKLLPSLEKSDFSKSERSLTVKIRDAYIKYKESCVNYTLLLSAPDRRKAARFASSTLQKNYVALQSASDEVMTAIEAAMLSDSTSLTKQHNLALRFITGAGIVPIAFWALLLIATFLWTSVAFRKLRPE
ncbi:MAG: MCP four helix bundle domain-containing protein [Fibrobacterota bacterium]|jgi:hypothetical protein|nr:MCP four helix bundle domain-containing protein [Chitinispirillaceae bacterium]